VRAAAYQVLADRPRSETFVMTNALCLGSPREREAWGHVVTLAETRAVPLVPVVLEADDTVLRSRVQRLERQGRKLTDPDALAAMIRSDRLLKPDVPERLDLDTTHLAAADAAGAIEAHLRAVRGRLVPADARHLTPVNAP
jgi:hypothetical protein